MAEKSIENVFEFINGQETVTCTVSQLSYITKIQKLAEKYPEFIKILSYDKKNRVMTCHIPLRVFGISNKKLKNMSKKLETTN